MRLPETDRAAAAYPLPIEIGQDDPRYGRQCRWGGHNVPRCKKAARYLLQVASGKVVCRCAEHAGAA